jgi:hypothetical protein
MQDFKQRFYIGYTYCQVTTERGILASLSLMAKIQPKNYKNATWELVSCGFNILPIPKDLNKYEKLQLTGQLILSSTIRLSFDMLAALGPCVFSNSDIV